MQRARELRPPKALLFLTHRGRRRQTKYNEIVKKTPRGEAGHGNGSNINLTREEGTDGRTPRRCRDSASVFLSKMHCYVCGPKKAVSGNLIWV